MSKIERKLRDYIDAISENNLCARLWESWAFGAVDFAYATEMINAAELETVMKYYKALAERKKLCQKK